MLFFLRTIKFNAVICLNLIGKWGCLVGKFKDTFEHFKQHYTRFHTLFYPHV